MESDSFLVCKYPVHTKCLDLVPSNCPKQEIKDPNSKKPISRTRIENMGDLVLSMQKGMELKTRKTLLKTYENSFLGLITS
jgi:hypothetical protein